MSIATIREYDQLATDDNGRPIQVGLEPALATQVVNNPATTTQITLNEKTRFVLISANGALSFHMQRDNNPVATAGATSKGYLPDNAVIFLGVQSGGVDQSGARTPAKIAFINDT